MIYFYLKGRIYRRKRKDERALLSIGSFPQMAASARDKLI